MKFNLNRRRSLTLAGLLAAIFAAIQFVPVQRNEGTANPPSDFMQVYPVPEAVSLKLTAACYDCHSNNTRYPWYNKVQPVAWFLEGHIADGKAALNFSEWDNYSARRRRSKLRSIISQLREGKMPPSSYSLMHADARLSKAEKETVLQWLQQLKDSL